MRWVRRGWGCVVSYSIPRAKARQARLKRCNHCGELLEARFFGDDCSRADGKRGDCKACRSERRLDHLAKVGELTSEQKARAWEWAAESIKLMLNDRRSQRLHGGQEWEHINDVVLPHLRRQAARIRASSKARRERDGS